MSTLALITVDEEAQVLHESVLDLPLAMLVN